MWMASAWNSSYCGRGRVFVFAFCGPVRGHSNTALPITVSRTATAHSLRAQKRGECRSALICLPQLNSVMDLSQCYYRTGRGMLCARYGELEHRRSARTITILQLANWIL